MAIAHTSIHIDAKDVIKAGSGGKSRWITVGDELALFAPDAKLVELRDAIDADLAQSFAKAEAA